MLAGLAAASMDERERSSDASMEELAALVETAGGETVAMLIQNRPTPEPRSFIGDGKVQELKWFNTGYNLMNSISGSFSILDCNTGVTWNAKYINGKNHADVIPASATDAQLLTAYSITGSYVRRPCIITINGTKYAGSMYAVGHGTTNYCSWFSGVMCIHFTGSKTHTSGRVDADHQKAIQSVLTNFN